MNSEQIDNGAAASEAQWADNATPMWTPECWHKSPREMQAEAAAINHACHTHAAFHSTKHDNPPLPPNRMRLL